MSVAFCESTRAGPQDQTTHSHTMKAPLVDSVVDQSQAGVNGLGEPPVAG